MQKDLKHLKKLELEGVNNEIKDLFEIYLDSDIAGDNQDRRNKLAAVKKVSSLLNTLN